MDAIIESRFGVDAPLGVEWTELARLPAATPEDLGRVEAAIATHLSCEPGRCAWVRSQPFLRLRMTALYFPRLTDSHPITLFHQGLRVVLRAGHVTLSRQDPTHGSFFEALLDIAVDAPAPAPPAPSRKRGRQPPG